MGRTRPCGPLRPSGRSCPSGPAEDHPSGATCPSGAARHLPMNGEDKALRPPPALREELPLRPFGPPPHEWGGQGRTCPSGPAGHLPMNGEEIDQSEIIDRLSVG